MARKSSLEGRLLAVLSDKLNRRRLTRALTAAAILLSAAIAVPLAMLRAADEQPAEKKPTASAGTKLPPAIEAQLDWGEPVNGLRGAIVIRPTAPGAEQGVFLAVQNVSDKSLHFADTTGAKDLRKLYVSDTTGILFALTSIEPTKTAATLQPGEVAYLRLLEPTASAQKSVEPEMIEGLRKDPLQTWRAVLDIENAPDGAWKGKLTTGETRGAISLHGPQPKDPKAQALYKAWQSNARLNGDIPGGLVRLLHDKVQEFIRNNEPDAGGAPYAAKMKPLEPRFGEVRDWKPAEVVQLLDDIAAANTIPLEVALWYLNEHTLNPGQSLTAAYAKADWGAPLESGLRMAYLLEPRAGKYHLGTEVKARILLHNSGREPVAFIAGSFHQPGHKAKLADGSELKLDATEWLTRSVPQAWRLAPGEYIELHTPGLGIGAQNKDRDDWASVRAGSWILCGDGDEVTFLPGGIMLSGNDSKLDGEPRPWWPEFITERLKREAPVPMDTKEREYLLYRVVRDLFGTAPSTTEGDAFAADKSPDALQNLAALLTKHAYGKQAQGMIQASETKFRVLPPDPDAAKRVRVASNPGYYNLSDTLKFSVTRRPQGARIINEASFIYFHQGKDNAITKVELPYGYNTWAAALEPGTPILWIKQKDHTRRYDFTDPAQIKETRHDGEVPARVLEAMQPILATPEEAPARKDNPPPAATAPEKKTATHKTARALHEIWQQHSRANGEIPGALIGELAAGVKRFIRYNPTLETVPQLNALLPRLDASRDWKPADAIALLDEVAAIKDSPLDMTLSEESDRVIVKGQPLPKELANAGGVWGAPGADGLRVAWDLQPRRNPMTTSALELNISTAAMGEALRARLFLHNSGKKTIVVRVPTFLQCEVKARDVEGKAVECPGISWTTLSSTYTCRLAPGKYVEINTPGIGFGKDAGRDPWAGPRIGWNVLAQSGGSVRLEHAPVPLDGSESGRREDAPFADGPDWWPACIKARLARELPLPADATERARLLERAADDLFGSAPTAEEREAFAKVTDDNSLAAFSAKLAQRPDIVSFFGKLKPVATWFKIADADANADKRPRVALGPGEYPLPTASTERGSATLKIVGRPVGDRRTNDAQLIFEETEFTGARAPDPHKLELPDGWGTWAVVCRPTDGFLYVLHKGGVRKIDFTKPREVTDTPATDLPAEFRDEAKRQLEAAGVSAAQQTEILEKPAPPAATPEQKTSQAAPVPTQPITDGKFSAQVLRAEGLEPVVILTGRALTASPDSTSRSGAVTMAVETSAKTETIRYTWPEDAPGFLDLKTGGYPVARFDLSRGRVFFVHFEKLEFSADVFLVPAAVKVPAITSPETLTQAAAAVTAWHAASDDRALWECSRVVVPASEYKNGQPLDAAAEEIVWGEVNDVGLRLGLGGLEPGASFPVGQQLPVKQYIRNDSTKTITFSPTQIFNEGVGGELVRVSDGKTFPHQKGYPAQMFFDRVRLVPGHYIALGSGPMSTTKAGQEGTGAPGMMSHGFTVAPGDYKLQLNHGIGQFLGRPMNARFGDPRLAPGLGEWTGVLKSAPVSLRLSDEQIKTAKAGSSEDFGTRYTIAFDKGVIKLRYYNGYPKQPRTGGSGSQWEEQSRDWKIPAADGEYVVAWAVGGNGLWVKDSSGITHLVVKETLAENGRWTLEQADKEVKGMPAGVRAALQLPAAEKSSAAAPEQQPSPVAPKSADATPKSKHEYAQSLFKSWQANARSDGKIPGALVGMLAEKVDEFLVRYGDHKNDLAKQRALLPPLLHGSPVWTPDEEVPAKAEANLKALKALRAKLDATRDWPPAEAVAMLDELNAIAHAPLGWAEMPMKFDGFRHIKAGKALPKELESAAWGTPAENGMRAAWLLEPRAEQYAHGTVVKARVLFHNAGKEPVVFQTETWHQYDGHKALDAKGAEIKVGGPRYTGITPMATFRLAPGEYCEVTGHGLAIGAGEYKDEFSTGSVGAIIEAKVGDMVTLSHTVDFASGGWTRPNDPKDPAELRKKQIAERIAREAPLPAAVADRELLLRRVALDLTGVAPTLEEIAAFNSDPSPDALANLTTRLQNQPAQQPWAGKLPTGETKFRVIAADPNAAKAPRTATGPGRYVLGDTAHLLVRQVTEGGTRTNSATIAFLSADPKVASPHKPHEIALPDGLNAYAFVWDRGAGKVWLVTKGVVRSYDFTNPSQVKETRIEPGSIINIPQHLQESLKDARALLGASAPAAEKPKGAAVDFTRDGLMGTWRGKRNGEDIVFTFHRPAGEQKVKLTIVEGKPDPQLPWTAQFDIKQDKSSAMVVLDIADGATYGTLRPGENGTLRLSLTRDEERVPDASIVLTRDAETPVSNEKNSSTQPKAGAKLDRGKLEGTWEGEKDGATAKVEFQWLSEHQQVRWEVKRPGSSIAAQMSVVIAQDGNSAEFIFRKGLEFEATQGRLTPGEGGTLNLEIIPNPNVGDPGYQAVKGLVLKPEPATAPPKTSQSGKPLLPKLTEDAYAKLGAPEHLKTATAKLTPDALLGTWRGTVNGEKLMLSFHRPPAKKDVQCDIYFGEATIGALAGFTIAEDGGSAEVVQHSAGGGMKFGTLIPDVAGKLKLEFYGRQKGQQETILTRDAEQPATEPRQKEARELYDMWKLTANADGMIPGTFIGRLASEVRVFVKANPNLDSGMKLPKLLPRFVTSRDWTQAEAMSLLDDVAYYSTAPIEAYVAKAKLPGDALWRTKVEFQDLPVKIQKWSEPLRGLRVGLHVVGGEWRIGGKVRIALWLHNTSDKDITFDAAPGSSESVTVSAVDAAGGVHHSQGRGSHRIAVPPKPCTLPAGFVAEVKNFELPFEAGDPDQFRKEPKMIGLKPGTYKLTSSWMDAAGLFEGKDWKGTLTTPELEFTLKANASTDGAPGAKPPEQAHLWNDKYSAVAYQNEKDVNFVLVHEGFIATGLGESWSPMSGKWSIEGNIHLVDQEKTEAAGKNVDKRVIALKHTSDEPTKLYLDGKSYDLAGPRRATAMGALQLPGRIFILRDEGEPVQTDRTLALRNKEDLVTISDFAARDLTLAVQYADSRRVRAMEGWVLGWDVQHSVQHGDGERAAMLRIFADGRVLALQGGGGLKEFKITPDEVTALLGWLVEEQKVGEWKPEMVKAADGAEFERDPVKNMWDRETDVLFFTRDGKRHGIAVEQMDTDAQRFNPIRERLRNLGKQAP